MLKIDKDLNKSGNEQNKQDEHNDGDESSQQALLSEKGTPDTFTDPQLAFVNKLYIYIYIYYILIKLNINNV